MYKHLHLLFLQNVEDTTRIVFLMKQCKATVWCRDEIQNGQKKSIKEYHSAGDKQFKRKGGIIWFWTRANCLYLTLRVGFSLSTNQTIAQKSTTDWLIVRPLGIWNLKTPLYNHRLQPPFDCHWYQFYHTIATILCSLSSSEYVLII